MSIRFSFSHLSLLLAVLHQLASGSPTSNTQELPPAWCTAFYERVKVDQQHKGAAAGSFIGVVRFTLPLRGLDLFCTDHFMKAVASGCKDSDIVFSHSESPTIIGPPVADSPECFLPFDYVVPPEQARRLAATESLPDISCLVEAINCAREGKHQPITQCVRFPRLYEANF